MLHFLINSKSKYICCWNPVDPASVYSCTSSGILHFCKRSILTIGLCGPVRICTKIINVPVHKLERMPSAAFASPGGLLHLSTVWGTLVAQLNHHTRGAGVRMVCAGFQMYNSTSVRPSVGGKPPVRSLGIRPCLASDGSSWMTWGKSQFPRTTELLND